MADVVHQKFGLVTQTSRTVEESAPLDAELLTADGWTSIDWTGDFANGFDHNTGNTTALTNTLAAVINYYYQITYTVTGWSAGTFTITFGGQSLSSISATGSWGPKAITTGTLSITPTSLFDGKIVISIKQNTGAYNPVYKILNSAGSSALEIRSTTNGLNNTFIGIDVGGRNTTGNMNTVVGYQTLCYNTTGYGNAGIEYQALYTNVTGYNNTAIGYRALYSSTGNNNTAIGLNALYANTTGTYNVGVGYAAGRYTNTTPSSNQTSSYSTYLGVNTRSSASGSTNETVIGYDAYGNGSNTVTLGNTSVTGIYMGATKLIGVQGAAVADATGADDVVAQLNTLLARIRAHGLIAT